MLIPAFCSLIYKEDDIYSFLISGVITFIFGITGEQLTKSDADIDEFNRKDGFFIASFCWISAIAFGALPYLIYGVFSNPLDAFFESTAGFTTTGASVVENIEILPHGILFWRSFTQWLGGMGILILAIAILPKLSVGGMQLMNIEAPGPSAEKLTPRIAETAKHLWTIYLILSVLLFVILKFIGLPVFDSIIHVFSTVSIGGFSNQNASIGAYNSAAVEFTIVTFMFISGINYALLFWLSRGKFKKLLSNPEFKSYAFIIVICVTLVTIDLFTYNIAGLFDSFRYAAFNVTSISTTTGFISADYDTWPVFSRWLLIILMFVGGCSGSTAGSIKVMRIIILIKHAFREIKKNIYPNAVLPIRFGKNVLEDNTVSSIINFFLIYIFIFILSTIIITLDDVPIITAFTACAATIGNVGPGMELVGPTEHYGALSNLSKTVLSFLMIIGRLELFAILVIFTPSFWKN
ncbi:MAG: TrkH family potassium uptake protein [Candidatus Dadabacteria bacterium]|nr:TrkH family potassium uptake protein [Candidatus Dadabacteria bacterium]NIS09192.1 TrkH family potassium uptake protein [Candidatus Dadabacteria bacterium]NIY22623.1 TrkH family potassium uptake protein [Candidatus Dadabacteria bacterium]